MPSILATNIYNLLKDVFPNMHIIKEYYVNFKNTRLFFDFYIKELGVLVEVQGRQHTEFVKHFHGDKRTFLSQKRRDNLKITYIQEADSSLCLIRFNYDEKITKKLILKKINKALEEGFCG